MLRLILFIRSEIPDAPMAKFILDAHCMCTVILLRFQKQ
jgi:hypothetical protein